LPHGLSGGAERIFVRTEACIECHAEQGGPWVYEHEGDRNLGCISCHEHHGSSNRRLLTYAEPRLMCMSCHPLLSDLPHAQNPGSPFRSCLKCHTEVHGSNIDALLLR
jgi:predicted CXXCH cytochrome family protein